MVENQTAAHANIAKEKYESNERAVNNGVDDYCIQIDEKSDTKTKIEREKRKASSHHPAQVLSAQVL